MLQTHNAKDGSPKLVSALTLPATALACVDRVITDLGVFDPKGDHYLCIQLAEGVGRDEVTARTGAAVRF